MTLLQSSTTDTLEVRSPRREPDTSGLVSTDLVRVYLNTIGKTALLTAEQEVELSKRIEAGLYADTRKGRRPSWSEAAPGEVAEPLVDEVVAELRRRGCTVATGVFGARMQVSSVNDGPMTLLLEV